MVRASTSLTVQMQRMFPRWNCPYNALGLDTSLFNLRDMREKCDRVLHLVYRLVADSQESGVLLQMVHGSAPARHLTEQAIDVHCPDVPIGLACHVMKALREWFEIITTSNGSRDTPTQNTGFRGQIWDIVGYVGSHCGDLPPRGFGDC